MGAQTTVSVDRKLNAEMILRTWLENRQTLRSRINSMVILTHKKQLPRDRDLWRKKKKERRMKEEPKSNYKEWKKQWKRQKRTTRMDVESEIWRKKHKSIRMKEEHKIGVEKMNKARKKERKTKQNNKDGCT